MERQIRLFWLFVDLTKAFDTVNRVALRALLLKVGIPPLLTDIIMSFMQDMEACVEVNGERTEPFAVENGVRQGCVIGPLLFLILFEAVVQEALQGWDGGVEVEVDFAEPFTSKKAGRSAFKISVTDLKFADDLAAPETRERRMQEFAHRLQAACDRWGLKISIKKTEMMVQPGRGEEKHTGEPRQSTIAIKGQPLQEVEQFRYLGCVMSNDGSLNGEIYHRIQKAGMVWGKLQGEVWKRAGLTTKTKMHMFRGAVLPALLYGAETWAARKDQIGKLESWCMARVRQVTNQPRQERTPDAALRRAFGLRTIESTIRLARLRWLGHVGRMGGERLPRQLLFGHLQGERPLGRPLLRWSDCVLSDFRLLEINEAEWQTLASHRGRWRALIQDGVKKVEERAAEEKEKKREVRKGQRDGDAKCEACGRTFSTPRGLRIHTSKAHKDLAPRQPEQPKKAVKEKKGSWVQGCQVKEILRKYKQGRGWRYEVAWHGWQSTSHEAASLMRKHALPEVEEFEKKCSC
uniref:C2H2-type domain-containing protein n=2 Tax=Chromera velia CCMP2878 TaxID=1169474 RepID=A0A0G4HDT3_9ALVE|eukprot:Cvel_6409.t1-p1 / transcript=Cvel_6409.t1 / gene=Cvel_6409 / organism=Chromera_velia_CCMP2878 / gene_product=Putative uncharacterized transposon-derived protein, putative / transcript_product=Putative uncharacterized transposon-derived protein, putative / location=Cvel_scaffold313:48468-50021(-) / protein_length=518 / sequence_SO=supercontig / SO=protein_coding / is_pseudo=false